MIKSCLHCGEDTKDLAQDFCCAGCDAAYKIIGKLGFSNYYKLREIKLGERKIKPDLAEKIDVSEFVFKRQDGSFSVSLVVQGLHCAACVWLIESILRKEKNVISARINLSRKTLFLHWQGDAKSGNELVNLVQEIGYKLLPFDEEILKTEEKKYNDSIVRALAVAGFGMGNMMLFSIAFWLYGAESMGKEIRNLLQFFSALIALPVIIFSSRPFFSSAAKSIKSGYPNMDLAISIAIFLACIVSLLETFRGASHVYFDSAVMLIFFLLIGRYLDMKARKKAFAVASEFALLAASFGRVEIEGKIKILPSKQLQEGMILLVAAGEKIAADGVIIDGESEIDNSLISGESLPSKASQGKEVFGGTINLSAPLRIKITKSPKNSLLSEIVFLSEQAESKKNHYIRIADRLAIFYTPAVHALAFATFCFWYFFTKSDWEISLMNATAVLIITCPCALALAVPIVQTIAISNFIRRGILVKSGEALEKLREIEIFVFDKTGSLTLGRPRLVAGWQLSVDGKKISIGDQKPITKSHLKIAASLAKKSRHPISQAIFSSYDGDCEELKVVEQQGLGLEAVFENKVVKLGRKSFCEIVNEREENFLANENHLSCYMKFGEDELIFFFEDEIKSDAKSVILQLKQLGKKIILLSGDEKKIVSDVAKKLEIEEFFSEQTPLSKAQFLENLKNKNQKFVMIGDGLNDAPALALSDVSISFSRAADISQNIADIVIQGEKLQPILSLISSSKKAILLMKQNLIIALIYNLIAVPFAVAGHVVPLVAAFAMSSSSLLVLGNSLKMNNQNQV